MNESMQALARAAAREFGLAGSTPEPVESVGDAVFRIRRPGGDLCLKLLGAGIPASRVGSQVEFMGHLREAGVPVVEVVETPGGSPFVRIPGHGEERLALFTRWIEGRHPGAGDGPSREERAGELLALIHEHSRRFRPGPGFDARRWDEVYAPGPGGWLDGFLERGLVDEAGRDVILAAAERVRSRLGLPEKGGDRYGLIHADFHGENLIDDGERLWVLDFEEFGWGHYLFDITWPVALLAKKEPDTGPFLERILRGYERRRPLSPEERERLGEHRLTAGIAVIDMVYTSPVPQDGPVARAWYDFAVSWLERHLGPPKASGDR